MASKTIFIIMLAIALYVLFYRSRQANNANGQTTMYFLVTTRFDSCIGSHTYEYQFASYKEAFEALNFEATNMIGEAILQVWKAGKDFKKLIVEKEV